MEWTATNLVIQVIGGILGAHIAAVVAKEHRFGVVGHTVAGAAAGALSGYFLQEAAGVVVTGTGAIQNDANLVTKWGLQVLTGLVVGALSALMVGMLKQFKDESRA